MDSSNSFLVFCGTNTMYLAKEICDYLNCPLGNMNVAHFADGEFAVSYEESIRGADVFLVQSTFPSSDNLMDLFFHTGFPKCSPEADLICTAGPATAENQTDIHNTLNPIIKKFNANIRVS